MGNVLSQDRLLIYPLPHGAQSPLSFKKFSEPGVYYSPSKSLVSPSIRYLRLRLFYPRWALRLRRNSLTYLLSLVHCSL